MTRDILFIFRGLYFSSDNLSRPSLGEGGRDWEKIPFLDGH